MKTVSVWNQKGRLLLLFYVIINAGQWRKMKSRTICSGPPQKIPAFRLEDRIFFHASLSKGVERGRFKLVLDISLHDSDQGGMDN